MKISGKYSNIPPESILEFILSKYWEQYLLTETLRLAPLSPKRRTILYWLFLQATLTKFSP